MTPKQRQLSIRKKQLVSFRRYLALDGDGDSVVDFLDMNALELRAHIESQWLEGMDWNGYRKVWVVDHIVALKYFDMRDQKQMKLCWSYHNLKPSFIWDNHAKGYCVEITLKELYGLPNNPVVGMLINHVADKEKMFEPYY